MVARRARNLRFEGGEKFEITGNLSGGIESGASDRTRFCGPGLARGTWLMRETLEALAESAAIASWNFPTGVVGEKRL